MKEDRIPVLVASGQFSLPALQPDGAKNSVELLEAAIENLVKDSGVSAQRLASKLEVIACVQSLSSPPVGLPAAAALALGAQPKKTFYSTTGGNTPQWYVNQFSAAIARGEMQSVLLAGLEMLKPSVQTVVSKDYRARANSIVVPKVVGDTRMGTNAHEVDHGLSMPVQVYPLFENALRAHYGHTMEKHQTELGDLYEGFSRIAANNPYAWFQKCQRSAEITQVTEANRYIGFPYTKFMNPIIGVNQAATCLLTSVAVAKEMGIDSEHWISPIGVGDCHDHWFPTERANFYSSPAIHLAAQSALEMARVDIDEIDFFDLYSCFPSAVEIARDEIGLSAGDPRALTVTGGLRFAGGPGNNYPMHSIATMMHKLRANPQATGMVSGLGWNITKHSYCIYAHYSSGSLIDFSKQPEDLQRKVDVLERVQLVPNPIGHARVETYTVLFDRQGQPNQGVIVGRLDTGQRFLANTEERSDVFEQMMQQEIVGCSGRVESGESVNRFYFE